MNRRTQLVVNCTAAVANVATLLILGYVAYRLFGHELACVPPAEYLEELKSREQQ